MRRLATALLTLALAFATALAGAANALACLPPAPVDGQIQGFRLVAGAGGEPAVAWWEYRRDAPEVARAAALSGGAWTWAAPGSAPAPAVQGLPYSARVSEAAGAAVAVWQQGQGIYAASRSNADALGPWQLLADEPGSVPGGFFMDPTVALGAGGHAIALWTRTILEPAVPGGPVQANERRVVRAADRAPDGTWSAPYDLAPPGAARQHVVTSCGPWHSEQPAVAVDGAGNAVAVWESWLPEYDETVTMWSARPVGDAWAAPALLTAGQAYSVRLAMDATGTAHAAWIEDKTVRSARRPPGGAFGPAEVVGPAYGARVALEVNAAGRSVAVWQASSFAISAATRPAGGPWSDPVDLTALEKPGPGPKGETDRGEPPALMERLRISRRTMRQPVCALRRGAARRACRTAGAALTFRLSAPGEVRVTVQRRGRGKALRGLRVAAGAGTHRVVIAVRPLPPGRYTVRIRVTAEDRRPEMASKQLVVRPA